ncbi:MAG: sugar-binding transcriptional regulator, partial [Hyphomicrobiales bacterium]
AEAVKARSFPMPLPVIASSAAERDMLLSQPMIKETHALAQQADIAFVGIGDLGPAAPLVQDGFLTPTEVKLLQKAGAVGEIVGWAFDSQGKFIDGLTNDRVASAPLPSRETSMVVAIAVGERKMPGIRAALTRRLVNGLITDERTAQAILAAE